MKRKIAALMAFILVLTGCGSTTAYTAGNGQQEAAAADEQSEPPAPEELVILEQEEDGYKGAADNKSAKVADVPSFTLRPTAAGGEGKAYGTAAVKKDCTVMVYVVGSNLESRYGSATNDIEEMRQAGLDYERNNLLVYTGGSKRWVSDIPNTSNNVIDMSKDLPGSDPADRAKRIVAQTGTSADMGTPQTLTEFINYCTSNYPAEHYGLVLWDHGGGPLWGYGSDELFKNDSLLMGELRSAMDATVFGQGRQNPEAPRLDWVGFDACLMGGLENARLWKDYADYLVGSEELEPGRGWDYSFLGILNETSDPRAVVSAAVDSYGSYYEKNRTQFFNPDVTLAALDLSRTDEVVAAADALFSDMKEEIEKGGYARLNQARSKARAFGLSSAISKNEAYDLIDLRDFAEKTMELFPDRSRALKEAVDGMVVRAVSNVEGTGGVSIYLPGDNRNLYEVAQDLYAQDERLSDAYEEFVGAYTDAWFAGSDTDWTLGRLQRGEGEWTLQLTPDQAHNASELCYTVLFRNGWGDYQIATCNSRIEADENNILHVPEDPLLLTAETDLQASSKPWACYQVADSGGERVYRTANTILTSGHEFSYFDEDIDEAVSVSVKNLSGERETTIQDITSSSGAVWQDGKGSIDTEGYNSIVDAGGVTICPVRDKDGQMKPYSQWEYKGYLFSHLAIDDSFRFFMKPASEFEVSFICQVTVKDVNGNLHGTEFVNLNPKRELSTARIGTEKGTLIFEIGENYAQLKSYKGEDTALTVPDTVRDKPVTAIGISAFSGADALESVTLPGSVTEIGGSAFYGTSALREIELPQGLRTIGMAAFRNSGIGEIELPEGLERIGRAAFFSSGLRNAEIPSSVREIGDAPFSECADLTGISVSGENPAYKAEDGVLYTADGRVLVQYPNGREGDQYTVAEGTEEIGYGAFAGAGLKAVDFPDTLRQIDNDAFFECWYLTQLQLPDSLERIGSLSFGRNRENEEVPGDRTRLDVVRIGPAVTFIGDDAFTALKTAAFEVDGENAVYASLGGMITNKAGDTIHTAPEGTGDPVVIPEGITTLQSGLFRIFDDKTQFYIPDSVFRFGGNVFPCGSGTSRETGKLEDVYLCRLHCSEGSAAWQYAAKYGIAHDSSTDPEERRFETAVQEGEHGTYYWKVYRNRAELCAFGQRDGDEEETLEIPSRYEDLPVTALVYDPAQTENNHSMWITKIVVPETVENIEAGFLKKHYFVTDIEVSPENPAYSSREGVLFTKDGKTLLMYPVKKEGTEYTIPKGVKALGEGAFSANGNIEKVEMPSSLRVIGKNCFSLCRNLREADFNRGLQEIDDGAFMNVRLENVKLPSSVEWIGTGAFFLTDSFGEILLPDQLRKMGFGAFGAEYQKTFTQEVIRIPAKFEMELRFLQRVLFERYEVDPKSPYYEVRDGVLMSKDGMELVSVPTLKEGELHVPEGVTAINYYALEGCDAVTDIYLPDSLLDVGNIGVRDNKTGQYKYVIHCREGSETQKKLEAKKVPWTPIE